MSKLHDLALKAALFLPLIFLGGCASITGQSTQPLSVQALSDEGEVVGAACELENSKGKWFVTTPGSTVIGKASDDLNVMCKKTGYDIGRASLTSKAGAGMWGNVLLGGGIGAIVDHNSGAAYNYPPIISVKMSKEGMPTKTEAHKENNSMSQTPVELEGREALNKCKELGFKVGTSEFGSCVVKLTK